MFLLLRLTLSKDLLIYVLISTIALNCQAHSPLEIEKTFDDIWHISIYYVVDDELFLSEDGFGNKYIE